MTLRVLIFAWSACAAIAASRAVPLDRIDRLELRGVKAQTVDYRGRRALKITEAAKPDDQHAFAILKDVTLRDGTIELEVSGATTAGADTAVARGFVGVAFRIAPDAKQFEYVYLRPLNGRDVDQVRRNHSVQYASHPDFPWPRLRKEEPEKYESYTDLEPGVWTKMRIVISGRKALLYVNGAQQPALVVNDLKLSPAAGGIGLWVGPGTEAHFANLTITQSDQQP